MTESKNIFVYFSTKNEDIWLGTVYVDVIRGKEIFSFEYSKEALKRNLSNIILDEDISFTSGRQFKNDSSSPYHFLEDSSPDRWGRNLIKRNASNRQLVFTDYLLLISDISRMGALRYKLDEDDDFLSKDNNIPPLKFINEFENIAYHYEEFGLDDSWKKLLLPGSSLGGARPKATFYDANGDFYLAKFNHRNDQYDISKIEYLTYLLAVKVGINVSESKLLSVNDNRSVFITKRFDRNKNERYHYSSFMTLLNAKDGESMNHSYLEMVEVIIKMSNNPEADLKELFKRIAFYNLIHNYDDHLRNHSMIFKDGGWRLSPCYDINISFDANRLILSIDCNEDTSNDYLIENAIYFRLDKKEARDIVSKMRNDISVSFKYYCQDLKIDKDLTKYLFAVLDIEQ